MKELAAALERIPGFSSVAVILLLWLLREIYTHHKEQVKNTKTKTEALEHELHKNTMALFQLGVKIEALEKTIQATVYKVPRMEKSISELFQRVGPVEPKE